ncbi:DUF4174 domain-containing protein [Paracoccaceae bacterium Fryx2]|nr:DUF4174 domain-containing protein [Paracoccaceae bacterium Fryx2]
MKPLHILVLAAFMPLAALAGEAPVPAAEVVVADLLWLKRPIVVFADSPDDPAFQRQMALLAADPAALAARDVIVITDTDPDARSALRLKLRPRGFSLVLMDKDFEAKMRKPLPWDVREITRAIDKFPLVRQEELEKHPSGR